MRHLLGSGKGGGGGGAEPEEAAEAAETAAEGGMGAAAAAAALVGGMAADKWVPVFLTLSARTTANMVQDQVRLCIWGTPASHLCN
jgi:hypothetical protein